MPRLEAGVTARGAVDLTLALHRGGGRSLIVSADGRLVPEALRAGGTHINFPVDSDNPMTLLKLAFRLIRIIRKEKVDLIHARSAGAAWAAAIAKRYTGVPVVATLHDYLDPALRHHRRYARAIARADQVIAVSHAIATHAMTDHDVPAERLVVIPRGINLTRFNPGAVQADRVIKLAHKWLLPDGVPLILMPAQISPDKGHEVLIDALELLGERPFVCFLLGDDRGSEKYREHIEELAVAKGLSGKLRFVGFCDDMPAAYMLADVVVSANVEPEAFGLVSAEAQAMGRPVIASTSGSGPELVLPDETGWLVDPGDSMKLATAINRVISLDVTAREALALSARDRVVRHFSADQMCAKTLGLYRALLDRQSAPA